MKEAMVYAANVGPVRVAVVDSVGRLDVQITFPDVDDKAKAITFYIADDGPKLNEHPLFFPLGKGNIRVECAYRQITPLSDEQKKIFQELMRKR